MKEEKEVLKPEKEESVEDIQERVEDMTTTSFSIAGCPIKVFKRFIAFCEDNAKVTKIFYQQGKKEIKEELCYSIGLKTLLDLSDKNAVNQLLYDRITVLEDKLAQLEGQPIKEEKTEIKTMGRKDDEVKENVKAK